VFGLINAESYDVSFSIFNRWGQMVFHTNDPEQSWDGRFEGKLQAMDTYVYVVTYPSLEDGSVRILRGSLTLLD
ncbi:MAG TPA: gliding motility-associated C-terminal domain-containing protein, partial [Chitinophagales bacterium]|nr:gliding motility-associated C-terminal domain-containing protein [Chitinophagales bacterium]